MTDGSRTETNGAVIDTQGGGGPKRSMRTGIEPLTIAFRDVCFCHWPVPETHVSRLVPDWLVPDTVDGSAWLSAVSVEMSEFDVFGLPVREDVLAVNLRTYVRGPSGDRGVYFCSLDATDRPAVEAVRRLFRLPAYFATIDLTRNDARTTVRVARRERSDSTLAITCEASGPNQTTSPDTIPSFLAERYRYFTEGPFGTRLVGSVGHAPWTLQSAVATVTEDSLLQTVGLDDPDPDPLAHYSTGTTMRIDVPRPISMGE